MTISYPDDIGDPTDVDVEVLRVAQQSSPSWTKHVQENLLECCKVLSVPVVIMDGAETGTITMHRASELLTKWRVTD